MEVSEWFLQWRNDCRGFIFPGGSDSRQSLGVRIIIIIIIFINSSCCCIILYKDCILFSKFNSYPNLFKRSFFFFVYERRVNFKKYEKTNLPNFDHLMNSSVYKMIHKMEKEPKRGIPARPAKVNAAEDIIERVVSIYIRSEESLSFKNFLEAKRFLKNEPSPAFLSFQKSPAFSIADDRSTRSVSHWTVAKKG